MKQVIQTHIGPVILETGTNGNAQVNGIHGPTPGLYAISKGGSVKLTNMPSIDPNPLDANIQAQALVGTTTGRTWFFNRWTELRLARNFGDYRGGQNVYVLTSQVNLSTAKPSVFPLRHGSRNAYVAKLQRALNKAGANLQVDGAFGTNTQTALINAGIETTIASETRLNQIISQLENRANPNPSPSPTPSPVPNPVPGTDPSLPPPPPPSGGGSGNIALWLLGGFVGYKMLTKKKKRKR